MRACSGPCFSKLKSLIEQKRNSRFGRGRVGPYRNLWSCLVCRTPVPAGQCSDDVLGEPVSRAVELHDALQQ